jgi:hypothetical protein
MSVEIVSVLVLAIVSAKVLYDQISGRITTQKLLLCIIILLFLAPAITYILPGSTFIQTEKLLVFTYSLENILAYSLLIILFWSLSTHSNTSFLSLVVTIIVSFILIWATWDPKWRPLQSVIRAFFVLFTMTIGIFALIRRQKNGLWMVAALLFLAFSLNPQVLTISLGQFEIHNFMKAAAIFSMGRALAAGRRPLFESRIK